MNVMDMRGMTVDQVRGLLVRQPVMDRPDALIISADDLPVWGDFVDTGLNVRPHRTGDLWQDYAFGRTLPIRVHVA